MQGEFLYKVGDAFLDMNGPTKGYLFEIVAIEDKTIYYIVNGNHDRRIFRSFDIWDNWLEYGEIIPATELMKALT